MILPIEREREREREREIVKLIHVGNRPRTIEPSASGSDNKRSEILCTRHLIHERTTTSHYLVRIRC